MTSTAINNHLRDLSPDRANFKPLPASTLSYHRRLCLGLAKLQQGRPAKGSSTVKLEEIIKPGETDEAIIRETKTLSLGLFRHRLKTKSDSVTNRELVPVLTAILRMEGKGSKRDPLDDAMEGAIEGADEG